MIVKKCSVVKEYKKKFGVLYLVDENPDFRKMLKISIQSLKKFHPDWPIKVIKVPSYHIPFWKKLYRILSFWKRGKRRNRAGQDVRIIAQKANAMLQSPFKRTLYLDVDTIVMKPLEKFRNLAMEYDVIITPLPWKRYNRMEKWQPETWPYMMAGILFYSEQFKEIYSGYVKRFERTIRKLPSQEQFILSLTCSIEARRLKILMEPKFQIDVLNLSQHLGTNNYPTIGDCVDLKWTGLKSFYVFHYNEYKPQYLKQIKEVWHFPLDDRN
jgi:hypothetical protein